jgi:hypothetical protein
LAKKRTKDNIIDDIAVSYISRLLKTEKRVIEKITDNEDDMLLVIEQACKKRLNKKTLLELHPRLAALLMVFREGKKRKLPSTQCLYLSQILYDYFFCLNRMIGDNNINFVAKKPSEKGSKLCLILTIFYEEAIDKYCKFEEGSKNYNKTKEFYDKYIEDGFKNCKKEVNLDNFKEVLEAIRDKYIKK